MLKTLSNINVWVHDQDEALAFYTRSSGWRSVTTSRCPSWATSAG